MLLLTGLFGSRVAKQFGAQFTLLAAYPMDIDDVICETGAAFSSAIGYQERLTKCRWQGASVQTVQTTGKSAATPQAAFC
jgi:hypothetical protein